MADFNKFIKGFEEPKEEQPKPGQYRITQSSYELGEGDKWNEKGKETYFKDKKFADTVLSDTIQPFEQSHRLYKQGQGSHKYDTYETISPDGKRKEVWYVESPEMLARAPKEAPKAEPKPNGYYKDEKGEIYMMKDGQDYYPVGEKERSDFFTAFNSQNKAQAEPKPLFDEYKLSTKEGIEEAQKFLGEKGIKDPYSLNNEQFNALADEAAKKYGIDRELAQEFLVAPYDEKEAVKPQPKQGSFNEVFGEEPKNYVVWYAEDENGHAYPVEVEDNEIAKQEMLEQLKDAGIKKVYGGATNWGGTDILYDRDKGE